MLEHTSATSATFDELAEAKWFSAVGFAATDKVLRVRNWFEAIEQASSIDLNPKISPATNPLWAYNQVSIVAQPVPTADL